MTARPVVSFFMIVTDRDIVIADYAVRSYAKIRDVPFTLVVYSNWVRSDLKAAYFPAWRRLPYVELRENPHQRDELKPDDRRLWGPFELGYRIWDRELKPLVTPYHATVDADFEILDGRFVSAMLAELERDSALIAMSTDYSPTAPRWFDSYSNEYIELNERWHTWFCIYKRAALDCPVSHRYHEEPLRGDVHRSVWDDAAYLQKSLREEFGYRLATLSQRFAGCYIHYGAFSHNTQISSRNVRLYRQVQILRRRGLFGPRDVLFRAAGRLANDVIFGRVNRSSYVEGWAQSGGMDGV